MLPIDELNHAYKDFMAVIASHGCTDIRLEADCASIKILFKNLTGKTVYFYMHPEHLRPPDLMSVKYHALENYDYWCCITNADNYHKIREVVGWDYCIAGEKHLHTWLENHDD